MNLVLRKMTMIDNARKEREEDAIRNGYTSTPYVTPFEQDVQFFMESITLG